MGKCLLFVPVLFPDFLCVCVRVGGKCLGVNYGRWQYSADIVIVVLMHRAYYEPWSMAAMTYNCIHLSWMSSEIRTKIASTVDALLTSDMDTENRKRYCVWRVHRCTTCAIFMHWCIACALLHLLGCTYFQRCIFHFAFAVLHLSCSVF